MSDVFSIANADLRNNNSQAWEYLDHLTSNSIYTDMLIANSAFIQQLTSEVVAVGSLITVGAVDDKILEAEGIAANDATTKANNALDAALAAFVGAGNVRDHTIISGGKIISGLIDVDAIKATQGFFNNITVTGDSEFNGVIYQGTKLYFANRIRMSKTTDGTYNITNSNSAYDGLIQHVGTGRFTIRKGNYKGFGTPAFIPIYVSDSKSTATGLDYNHYVTGDFAYNGSNPAYQLNVRSCGVVNFWTPNLELIQFITLFFTDLNTDQYIDPQYADVLLFYC